jgi:hypothetical protein
MAFLESLAQGLRSAGGVLSPDVYQNLMQEDTRRQQELSRRRDLMLMQTIKSVESGAIPNEVGQQVFKKFGLPDLSVGLSIGAQAQQEEVAKRREAAAQDMELRKAIQGLPPEERRNPYAMADVYFQYGKHKEGSSLLDRAEGREATLTNQLMMIDQRERESLRQSQDRANSLEAQNQWRAESEKTKREGHEVRRELTSLRIAQGRVASRLHFEQGVDPDTGKQVTIGRDPHTGEEVHRSSGGLKPISVFNAGEIDDRQARKALEDRIKPHQPVLDNYTKYQMAVATGDNSQVNLARAQIVEQMIRGGRKELKGDINAMLGSTFRGESIDQRLTNFVSQLTTGTVSDDILKKLDALVASQAKASMKRIHDEMQTETQKIKANKRDSERIVAPRVYGDVIIWPDVGARRYKTMVERDAALRAYEEERRGRQ